MSSKNPCINCITYAICKANIVDHIRQTLIINDSTKTLLYNSWTWEEIMISGYHIYLENKCSLIKSYVRDYYPHEKNIISVDPQGVMLQAEVIYQVMYKSFNLKEPHIKEKL